MSVSKMILFWLAAILATGCASPLSKQEIQDVPGPLGTKDSVESSVDITYTRGHNQHRLIAQAHRGEVLAQSYLDRQILTEGTVDQSRYHGFLQRALEFVGQTKVARNTATERFPCRSPFAVTVRVGADTRTTSGCRSNDEGALGLLVRDGEFLLYSHK